MQHYWLEFAEVVVAHALAVASPGPDFALVLRQSLRHGRRAAIWTSFGIGSGLLLHVAYSLFGIGLLIAGSVAWFTAVKYVGAAYLAWIGVQALRTKPRDEHALAEPRDARTPSAHGAFAAGFLTNALNPKATLFFLALFATVISPGTPMFVQAAYGAWMVMATAGWFCFVAVLFTREAVRRSFLRHGHWVDRALGAVFLGFATSLLLANVG